jgi:formylglycine-generating enzyme
MIARILLTCFLLYSDIVIGQNRLTNSVGMTFVLVEPGTIIIGEFNPPYPVPADTVKSLAHDYMMYMGDGRGYNELEFKLAKEMALKDSQGGYSVLVEKPYYVAVTEVTQGQWKKVMGYNPSQFKDVAGADSLPVENVSWKATQKFIKKLNRMEKGKRYRLPSEFEWEHAARAGAKKDVPWNEIQAAANLDKKMPIQVASKKPNAWGLYDMLGNVWEWVDDYYNDKLFADREPPKKGKLHVLKGASFVGDVKNATYMTHAAGPGNGWDVGFRVVMDVEANSK